MQGATFDTYVLSQGAISDSAYDVNAPTNASMASYDSGPNITPQYQPLGYQGIYTNTNFTGRIVNFFNTNDSVLALWVVDQEILKPSQFYSYNGTNCQYLFDPDDGGYRQVTDSQEARAQISRSRTLAIGQAGPAAGHGVIQSAVELDTQFGFTTGFSEHSAQWTRPIQRCYGYYDQLLESCLIPTIQR